MASTYTPNLELELQAAGDNSGTWGDPTLNQNVFTRMDAAYGDTVTVALTNVNVSLTLAQWRNVCIKFTGILTGNVVISFPLNPTASAAVGGTRVIDNQCTGNFTITVQTLNGGSTGVVVPQGVKSLVYSDKTNVTFADDRLGTTTIDRIPSTAGSPNTVVTGVAPTAYKPGSLVLDRTNTILYAATADGASGWVPVNGYFPNPQGYLTLTSGTAIITGDVTAATAVYYTPYVGNMVPIYNGSWLQAYFFSELTMTLSSSQAASQIYDVFAFLDSGSVVIGTGPAWTTATAGSGARGTGAGTTQLSRVNGLWVNTVSMTARNGASTYSVGASQGTYLGSIFMDATNGQVSCYRTWGQSRKWGVWNAYNRVAINLKAGDSTSSWTYASTTYRASNGSSSNSATVFCGLAEPIFQLTFDQAITLSSNTVACFIAAGWNSTSTVSGFIGRFVSAGQVLSMTASIASKFIQSPSLGINVVTSLEATASVAAGSTFTGGSENAMVLNCQWMG